MVRIIKTSINACVLCNLGEEAYVVAKCRAMEAA